MIYTGYWGFQNIVQNSQLKAWRQNWEFEAPIAEINLTIFNNGGRDPDLYLISEYSEKGLQALTELTIWNKVDTNYDYLSTSISAYKQLIQELHVEDSSKYKKLFSENPIEFTKDSLYFTKSKADGSYIIAVLHITQKRLYTLEVFY
ncbi:hypothetical protein GK047_20465 [Paenibacillus sp. SYP-B3998]|uniref:Uncharacterized protein n=1 Tax=Paenibacillus sp. SYP-B3998 TaxID=2678564 RepID=A0A6G4A362_9BACL|nr:hypothetical protein [Paenibacillus sp. SYP-B3998]NEW08374.1 hypothetical protein [Paenibacillus sp. SYP-B3998]